FSLPIVGFPQAGLACWPRCLLVEAGSVVGGRALGGIDALPVRFGRVVEGDVPEEQNAGFACRTVLFPKRSRHIRRSDGVLDRWGLHRLLIGPPLRLHRSVNDAN